MPSARMIFSRPLTPPHSHVKFVELQHSWRVRVFVEPILCALEKHCSVQKPHYRESRPFSTQNIVENVAGKWKLSQLSPKIFFAIVQ